MHSMKHLVKNGKHIKGRPIQTPTSFHKHGQNNRRVINKQPAPHNWASGGGRIQQPSKGHPLRGSNHNNIASRNLRNGLALAQRPGVSGVPRQGYAHRGGVSGGVRRKF